MKVKPGLVDATRDWFRRYKMPAGKPANTFAFDGKAKDKAFAIRIVDQTYGEWEAAYKSGSAEGSWAVAVERAAEIKSKLAPFVPASSPLPGAVDDWVYTSTT